MKTYYSHKTNRYRGLLPFAFCLPAAIGILFTFFAGCKKFVEIPPPTTQLVNTTVFNNDGTATAAMMNIYVGMSSVQGISSESYNMAESMGTYADELTLYDNSTDVYNQLYINALQATSAPGPWVNAYNYIYQANAIISGLQTVGGTSPAIRQQLTGESYFIRAFWHFYLANIYGDVPLVLTPNYTTNATLPRTARVTVLQQVAADLQTANRMLNSNYVDGSDTTATTERVRPNKAAALALLARTYLYLGDYSKNAAYYTRADSAATAVISNSNYSLSALNGVFLENSTEAIWQLQTPQPNAPADTYDGLYFILLGAASAGGSGQNQTTISPQLMAAFEPNDQRNTTWISSFSDGINIYYFPFKYQQNTNAGLEYTMVLRLGEQYLVRAEARAHEGNITGAQQDLNVIRSRAGLAGTTAAAQSALLTAILHERQVELFTEWGARWFDLCRTGNANAVMGAPGNVCKFKGGVWSGTGYQLLFPIPRTDIQADPNLKQNPGY